ncbi:MAG: hypothetical protein FWG75_03950 [Cystobacterineae bacterium]|nr:hypothetical protein [Cystobacterineae bacterium]
MSGFVDIWVQGLAKNPNVSTANPTITPMLGRPKPSDIMLFRPKCKICEQPSATIEVIPPHALPTEWAFWEKDQRQAFAKYRISECYQLLYDGPGGSNGWVGDAIDLERAERIVAAFSNAPSAEAIRAAGFYDGAGFCAGCGCFYCPKHGSVSATGFWTCPRGHGKSVDFHWHPALDD